MAASIPAAVPSAFAQSLQSLGRTVLEIVHARLELLAIELTQERDRVLGLLLFACLAVLLGILALFLGSVLFLVAWWDTPYRMVACTAAVLVPAIGATAALLTLRRRLRMAPSPLRASLENLAADFGVGQ